MNLKDRLIYGFLFTLSGSTVMFIFFLVYILVGVVYEVSGLPRHGH